MFVHIICIDPNTSNTWQQIRIEQKAALLSSDLISLSLLYELLILQNSSIVGIPYVHGSFGFQGYFNTAPFTIPRKIGVIKKVINQLKKDISIK